MPPHVASLLALLDEDSPDLLAHALKNLLTLVDTNWAEISEKVVRLEELAEREDFAYNRQAAELASKCFFHLEEYDDATRLALVSQAPLLNTQNEYSVTIVGRCLDSYVVKPDAEPRLNDLVHDLFQSCYQQGLFAQALGMALESKRIDKVREVIEKSGPDPSLLTYCLSSLNDHVPQREFRAQVYQLLADTHSKMAQLDTCAFLEWFSCLYALARHDEFAGLLKTLIHVDESSPATTANKRCLFAYQAVFDLLEFQDQRFEKALATALNIPEDTTNVAEKTLMSILTGGRKAAIFLDFLYKNNYTDPTLVGWLKNASVEGRKNSVVHHSVVVAYGYMSAGTTRDAFLRQNLEWLGRASNWAKFGSTASLGVIHKGNVSQSLTLLRPYLPTPGAQSASPYSEGGALFALGLIHASEGVSQASTKVALDHLLASLEEATTQEAEVARDALQHGACLGIGLVGMSSSSMALCERLRTVLFADSAVVGEAAALAIGLVMLGAGSEAQSILQDVIGYAHDTDHEKIIRAVGLACALIYYGKEDEALPTINLLVRDKDHLLRYGGVFCIGLAYIGTANNQALQRLLHVAVSDVSNDVRRAAVISLGFVMIRVPHKLPGLVSLLIESYNPHVRYGACFALGIGCSAMGDATEALQILEPLLEDKTDFVKQAAMMATALLLAQRRPENDARAKRFRELVYKVAADGKSASTMSRMGAILAAGLVDGGGRSASLSLVGRGGKPKPPAIAGVMLWTLSWYWYPCLHMISLAMSPSVLVGVNQDLDLPVEFSVECVGGEPHKRFGPPEPVEEKKEEVKTRVKTAVLSMTGKAKPSDDKAGAAGEEVPQIKTTPVTVSDDKVLANPIRVTKQMLSSVRFSQSQRYVPVTPVVGTGVFVLEDKRPGEEQKVTKIAPPPTGDVDPSEPAPPEPFEWEPPHLMEQVQSSQDSGSSSTPTA